MNKAKILKILNNQLEESTKVVTYSDLENWFDTTKEYIGVIYGFNSIQYKKFRINKSLPASPVESYLFGLVSDLKAYIKVINTTGLPSEIKNLHQSNMKTSNALLSLSDEINKLPKDNSRILHVVGLLSGLIAILTWFGITPKILFNALENFFK